MWSLLLLVCVPAGTLVTTSSAEEVPGECHPCYTLVEEVITAHRERLDRLAELLRRVGSGPAPVDDPLFETQLSLLNAYIQDLFNDARRAVIRDSSPLELLGDLQERVEEIKKVAGSILEHINVARPFAEDCDAIITEAEQIIRRIEAALRQTLLFLEGEGAEALRRAIEQSKQFSLQSARMSEIAREARQHADRHEATAKELDAMAKTAVTNASAAYDLAYDLVQAQRDFSSQMTRLDASVVAGESLLAQTKAQAEQAQREATAAYDLAFSVYTEARDGLTRIDVDGLQRRADFLKNEAQRMKADLEALTTEHGPLLGLLDRDISTIRLLMERGHVQQQAADRLMVDVMEAMDQASAAVSTGEATLQEARKTLDTLLQFDRQVQQSKAEADRALRQVQVILRLVEEAERKTSAGRTALQGADRNADQARDIARQAEAIAQEAFQSAISIQKESSATRTRAGELRDEATFLNGDVSDTARIIERFEEQLTSDSALAREALERANEAKTSAAEASARVDAALRQVRDIMAALAAAGDLDLAALEALERRLAAAEAELEAAQLEIRMDELRAHRIQINNMARDFSREVDALRLEVVNIQEISETLPDRCFAQVKLEP